MEYRNHFQSSYSRDRQRICRCKLILCSNHFISLLFGKALIYTGIQIPINKVLSLPFELYFDFIIEARHGFNKKTLKLFIIDEIKTFLLGVLIGSPILCIIIYVIRFGGRIFYIWVRTHKTIITNELICL